MFNKLIGGGGQADKELSVSRLPKLQLHALTDNPMNITVTGNITVSAELGVIVPTGSVRSPEYSSPGSRNKWSVTIPTNVKVVEVQDVGDKSPNYVGVTGGKTYTLTVVVGSEDFYYCYYSSSSKYWISSRDDIARILISWSPTINAKSPNITDY